MQISPYLKDYGIRKDEVRSLALGAHRVGQRLLPMNIREISEEDALGIFEEAYGTY
jgi:alcohol dehydrogenase class IV